MKTKQTSRVRT